MASSWYTSSPISLLVFGLWKQFQFISLESRPKKLGSLYSDSTLDPRWTHVSKLLPQKSKRNIFLSVDYQTLKGSDAMSSPVHFFLSISWTQNFSVDSLDPRLCSWPRKLHILGFYFVLFFNIPSMNPFQICGHSSWLNTYFWVVTSVASIVVRNGHWNDIYIQWRTWGWWWGCRLIVPQEPKI